MRVYNGTKSQLDLPLTNIQRIQIPSRSVSGDLLPNTEFLSLLVGSYNYNEIALIVSGPFEINMCSQVSGAVGFVVGSLEEAIERFTPKTVAPKPEEPKEEPKVEKVEEENPVVEEEEVKVEEFPTEIDPLLGPAISLPPIVEVKLEKEEEQSKEEEVVEEKPAKKLRRKVKK